MGPPAEASERVKSELTPFAGPEFTRRLAQHIPPPAVPLRIAHPTAGELSWQRETLALPIADAQQIVIFLPNEVSRRTETVLRCHDRLGDVVVTVLGRQRSGEVDLDKLAPVTESGNAEKGAGRGERLAHG